MIERSILQVLVILSLGARFPLSHNIDYGQPLIPAARTGKRKCMLDYIS
jgi:hypothetical protein